MKKNIKGTITIDKLSIVCGFVAVGFLVYDLSDHLFNGAPIATSSFSVAVLLSIAGLLDSMTLCKNKGG